MSAKCYRFSHKSFLVSWRFLWRIKSPQGLQVCLTLPWRRPISYRNQSIDLRGKSMDWFLYDIGVRHERFKQFEITYEYKQQAKRLFKSKWNEWKVIWIWYNLIQNNTHPAITCSKLTIETLEQGVK